MVAAIHVDNDFLVHAASGAGAERDALLEQLDREAAIEISAVAWYEFCRGPRTPEQFAMAHHVLGAGGVVPFDAALAERAAQEFRRLGRPRRRAADIAIGITAISRNAVLWTGNIRDYAGIDGLRLESVAAEARRR